jgi:sterol desaturase/sphingolipid hydroxylase (fatty acid hydroxylase superfamily)
MQEQTIILATPVFIALIFLEMWIGRRRNEAHFHFGDTLNSMSLGILSQVTFVFFQLFFFGIYAWVERHFSLFDVPNTWWAWLSGLLLYDFLYYWFHRYSHESAILWAAHVVHHQSERYNLTTALRQTSTGPFLTWIFYLPMAILGFPLHMFIAILLIDLLYQFWVHTELIGKLGWFDRVFVSPSNHRVHHATNDIYLDKNYGGILILWDRLFGSFIEEKVDEKVVYGTRKPLRSWNPIKANVEVYQSLIQDSRLASNWSDKLRVWFKHPGWQPADSAKQFPHAPFVLHHPAFEPTLPLSWKCYCGVQFVILLLITTHFLTVGHSISFAHSLLYGCWLGAGLFVIGGLTERRSNYLSLEAIRLILTIGFVQFTGNWFGEFTLPTFMQHAVTFIAICSLLGLLILFKDTNKNNPSPLS